MYNPYEEDAPPEEFDFNPEDEFENVIEPQEDFDYLQPNDVASVKATASVSIPAPAPTSSSGKRPFEAQESQALSNFSDSENFLIDSDDGNFDQEIDLDLQASQSENKENLSVTQQPASKRIRLEEPTPLLQKQASKNLPTLHELKEINLESKLQQHKLKNTQIREKILKTRQSNTIRKLMESDSQPYEAYNKFSKVMIVEPAGCDFCKIKKSDSDVQFYLKKKFNDGNFSDPLTQAPCGQSSTGSLTLNSDAFFKDFKKLKLGSLKVLSARKKKSFLQSQQPKTTKPKKISQNSELLVSKFAPNHFTSLLSDTTTNRVFLKWMQLWDHSVFGKPKMKKPEIANDSDGPDRPFSERLVNSKAGRSGQHTNPGGKFGAASQSFDNKYSKFTAFDPLLEEYNYDRLNRPKHKIILLSGPAGLGKTTLAHIAARHLGYKVQEINSSDDRSASAIKTLVKKYLSCNDVRTGMTVVKRPNQSKSQLTSASSTTSLARVSSLEPDTKIKKKPVCLVFDEIDGANSQAIDVIVNLVNNLPSDKSKSKNANKKSGGSLPVLKTPIVAICNDLYTPSLRGLRNVALVLHVPQLESSNMVRRLKEIQLADRALRRLDIPQSVFEYIVEKSEKDIRTALNSLQYVANMTEISTEKLEASNIGSKDKNKSLFEVWREFFKLKNCSSYRSKISAFAKIKSQGPATPSSLESSSNKNQNLRHALEILSLSGEGDYEKVLSGLHENFLNSTKSDANFKNLRRITANLYKFDLLNKKIKQSQVFQLWSYLPYNLVPFHLLYATGGGLYGKLSFPTAGSDFRKKARQNLEALISIESCTKIRDHLSFLPLLSKICQVTGTVRSIAPQMYNISEKTFIEEQVDRFCSNKISIKQEKVIGSSNPADRDNADAFGGYRYVIEPNIFLLSKFDQDEANGVVKIKSNISYAQTQYLANAIERENIERFENSLKAKNEEKRLELELKATPGKGSRRRPETPGRNLSPAGSGASTPKPGQTQVRATRLADQMRLLAMQSKTKKLAEGNDPIDSLSNNKKLSRSEMWKKFLNTTTTPKAPQNNLSDKKRTNSGTKSSKSTEEYMVEKDPGISNSDVWFKYQKGFCNSVRSKVKASEFL